MLAVVDTVQENLLIAKIVLRDANDLDERNYNLYNMLAKSSQWQVARVLSLENFNKAYIGVLGIDSCPLRETLIDLTKKSESTGYFPETNTFKAEADKAAGCTLTQS